MDWWQYRNVDLRLEKTFPTVRGQRIGVVAEMFNVFNFRNYSAFELNYGNYTTTGSTQNPAFGTPRQVITDLTRGGAPQRFQLGLTYGF